VTASLCIYIAGPTLMALSTRGWSKSGVDRYLRIVARAVLID
jgi:hypothetical protein